MSDKDDVTKPVKIDLDLDALSNSQKPTRRLAIKGKGMTIGEYQELAKKDPALLTAAQKAEVERTNKLINNTLKSISSPQIGATLIEAGKQARETLKGLGNMSNFADLVRPSTGSVDIAAIRPNPPASSAEQYKQTVLLEKLVEVFEAQNDDKYADLKAIITPRYDAKAKTLIFANRVIDVTKGKDYEPFCRLMFRNGLPRKTPVLFGDVLEKLYADDLKDTARVRNLINNFNTFIGKSTAVSDLFYARQKEVYFNAKYI